MAGGVDYPIQKCVDEREEGRKKKVKKQMFLADIVFGFFFK